MLSLSVFPKMSDVSDEKLWLNESVR